MHVTYKFGFCLFPLSIYAKKRILSKKAEYHLKENISKPHLTVHIRQTYLTAIRGTVCDFMNFYWLFRF